MKYMALIELSSVTKTYKLGDEIVHALDDASLKIEEGAFVAITGPSGSGKSTLANIIGGLDTADRGAGSVLVDGNELTKLSDLKLSQYRNHTIGFVFQSFNLQANMTAWENVALPLMLGNIGGRKRKERAMQCLKMVGMEDRARHKPPQLSGGQRQRVAIARALAHEPRILIADEPTGNLDSARGEEVMEVLVGLQKQGVTLLVVTHDPHIADMAERVLVIHDGKIKEGKH
jgi:putative ABC transport system ATP-binding protein